MVFVPNNKTPEPSKTIDENEDDSSSPPEEIGGREGPDPTRYGDWEVGGKCVDF